MNELISQVLEGINQRSPQSVERLTLLRALLTRVIELGEFETDTSELLVAATALDELLQAANMFSLYRDYKKLAVFGSARTSPDSPLYAMARDLSREMASQGWMTVSGAGGGIMGASAEGAGTAFTLGVNIELPFEQFPNPYIDRDTKLVEMKYFFTRKAALTRPSNAFAIFPGGYGTMDEAFEILTLIHTGKAEPAPIVLIDEPGGTYWRDWTNFVHDHLIGGRYIGSDDLSLVRLTSSVSEAIAEITTFYSNFQKFQAANGVGTIQLLQGPRDGELEELSAVAPTLARGSGFSWAAPNLHFPFDGRDFVAVRRVIDRVNQWS
jgi:uncharacterized protein (TIGR00730 family)